jgi:hypothetical protein
MKNGKQPIYPDPMRGTEQSFMNQSPHELPIGLTKREYFAGLAMQGWIANQQDGYTLHPETMAMISAQCADALLAELEQTEK